MLISKSRKMAESEGSLNSHLKFPNAFIVCLNWWRGFEVGFRLGIGIVDVVGFQIQITSSMNLR